MGTREGWWEMKERQTFQRSMEKEATSADNHVAHERDLENSVVAVLATVQYTFQTEINEEDVGEGVDNFGNVEGCVVILCFVSLWLVCNVSRAENKPPHTNSTWR